MKHCYLPIGMNCCTLFSIEMNTIYITNQHKQQNKKCHISQNIIIHQLPPLHNRQFFLRQNLNLIISKTLPINILEKSQASLNFNYIEFFIFLDWAQTLNNFVQFQFLLKGFGILFLWKLVYVFYLIESTYNNNILFINKMNISHQNQFDELIKVISVDYLYKKIVFNAQKKYLVKHLGLSTLSPAIVVKLVQRNIQKTNIIKIFENNDEKEINQTAWALNQFKIFTWISVCYAYLKNRQLQHFNTENYSFLQSLFTRKSLCFIQYHTKSIIKQFKNIRKSWTQQQIDILIDVIKTQQLKENLSWSQISFQLFLKSQKRYYRTPQKCREKWFNHLSPQVNRSKWTLEEDLYLFNSISDYGLKWALISKKFEGTRTEHMIKNRYNSVAKKYQSRAQKTTNKKLVQKIISDLNKKLNPLSSEQFSVQIQSQQQSEQLSIEGSITLGTAQVEEAKQPKKYQRLSSFDLEGILFNEEIDLQTPNTNKQVQMVQIEMYDNQPKQDEYLSTFFA